MVDWDGGVIAGAMFLAFDIEEIATIRIVAKYH